KRERRGVRVAVRELHAEWPPESCELVRGAGGECPFRADLARVVLHHRRCVGGRVGRYLEEHRAGWKALGELHEERGVQRTGFATGGVEGGDHDVLATNRREVDGKPGLIDKVEFGHRNELAGELAEAEIDLVVACIDRARDEMTGIDSEEQRLDPAWRDGHRAAL